MPDTGLWLDLGKEREEYIIKEKLFFLVGEKVKRFYGNTSSQHYPTRYIRVWTDGDLVGTGTGQEILEVKEIIDVSWLFKEK